jgi:hypothetical protein
MKDLSSNCSHRTVCTHSSPQTISWHRSLQRACARCTMTGNEGCFVLDACACISVSEAYERGMHVWMPTHIHVHIPTKWHLHLYTCDSFHDTFHHFSSGDKLRHLAIHMYVYMNEYTSACIHTCLHLHWYHNHTHTNACIHTRTDSATLDPLMLLDSYGTTGTCLINTHWCEHLLKISLGTNYTTGACMRMCMYMKGACMCTCECIRQMCA